MEDLKDHEIHPIEAGQQQAYQLQTTTVHLHFTRSSTRVSRSNSSILRDPMRGNCNTETNPEDNQNGSILRRVKQVPSRNHSGSADMGYASAEVSATATMLLPSSSSSNQFQQETFNFDFSASSSSWRPTQDASEDVSELEKMARPRNEFHPESRVSRSACRQPAVIRRHSCTHPGCHARPFCEQASSSRRCPDASSSRRGRFNRRVSLPVDEDNSLTRPTPLRPVHRHDSLRVSETCLSAGMRDPRRGSFESAYFSIVPGEVDSVDLNAPGSVSSNQRRLSNTNLSMADDHDTIGASSARPTNPRYHFLLTEEMPTDREAQTALFLRQSMIIAKRMLERQDSLSYDGIKDYLQNKNPYNLVDTQRNSHFPSAPSGSEEGGQELYEVHSSNVANSNLCENCYDYRYGIQDFSPFRTQAHREVVSREFSRLLDLDDARPVSMEYFPPPTPSSATSNNSRTSSSLLDDLQRFRPINPTPGTQQERSPDVSVVLRQKPPVSCSTERENQSPCSTPRSNNPRYSLPSSVIAAENSSRSQTPTAEQGPRVLSVEVMDSIKSALRMGIREQSPASCARSSMSLNPRYKLASTSLVQHLEERNSPDRRSPLLISNAPSGRPVLTRAATLPAASYSPPPHSGTPESPNSPHSSREQPPRISELANEVASIARGESPQLRRSDKGKNPRFARLMKHFSDETED